MPLSARSRMSIGLSIVALLAIVASLVVTGALNVNATKAHASPATASHTNIDCSSGVSICTEVQTPIRSSVTTLDTTSPRTSSIPMYPVLVTKIVGSSPFPRIQRQLHR